MADIRPPVTERRPSARYRLCGDTLAEVGRCHTHSEIASVLGITTAEVRDAEHSAMKKLCEAFAGVDPDDLLARPENEGVSEVLAEFIRATEAAE